MSRVSAIEQLYKKKSALEFNYDTLCAPLIGSIFSPWDLTKLCDIATSVKYAGNINKKYKEIIKIMESRWFRKANAGTNRIVFNCLEDRSFIAKIAVDRVGIKDNPAEYINQQYFAPFCSKIHEVDNTGVLAFIERVNPITSIQEFLSVADDIFNLMITKIIGKYVVDDLGTTKYMNYGLRYNSNGCMFGPVVIDFPYVFKLDGAKLICRRPIDTMHGTMLCGGEIDYDAGMNELRCKKCNRLYKARDLAEDKKRNLIKVVEGDSDIMCRVILKRGDEVIIDSEASSRTYITKDQYNSVNKSYIPIGDHEVGMTIHRKDKPKQIRKQEYYTNLMKTMYTDYEKREAMEKSYQKTCDVSQTVNIYDDRDICIITNDNDMEETIMHPEEVIEISAYDQSIQKKSDEEFNNPRNIILENIGEELVGKTLIINSETGEFFIQDPNKEDIISGLVDDKNGVDITKSLKANTKNNESDIMNQLEGKHDETTKEDEQDISGTIDRQNQDEYNDRGVTNQDAEYNKNNKDEKIVIDSDKCDNYADTDNLDTGGFNDDDNYYITQQPAINPNKNQNRKKDKKKHDKNKYKNEGYFDDSDPSAYSSFIKQKNKRNRKEYYYPGMEDY